MVYHRNRDSIESNSSETRIDCINFLVHCLPWVWVDLMDFVIHSLINPIKIVIGSTWSERMSSLSSLYSIPCSVTQRTLTTSETETSLQNFLCKCSLLLSFGCLFPLFSLSNMFNSNSEVNQRTLDSCLFNRRFLAKLVTSFSYSISITCFQSKDQELTQHTNSMMMTIVCHFIVIEFPAEKKIQSLQTHKETQLRHHLKPSSQGYHLWVDIQSRNNDQSTIQEPRIHKKLNNLS